MVCDGYTLRISKLLYLVEQVTVLAEDITLNYFIRLQFRLKELGGPRISIPGPWHSVNTEINTVARTRAKWKAGYFFVAHSAL
jgi:acyl-ACP thioesterase